jgi:predicted ferric reductase
VSSATVAAARPTRAERAGFWARYGVAIGALSATAIGYAWIACLQAAGRSAAAVNMPDMGMTDVGRYWAFPLLQASGLVGLGFAYLSMLLGLGSPGPITRLLPLSRRQLDVWHRHVGLAVVGLVAVHVVATVADAMGNTWQTVLIPGYLTNHGWPAAAWGFDIGIVAMYALLLLAPTYCFRRQVGRSRWRVLHRFLIVFYVLSCWHTLILGLDVAYYGWLRPTLWAAQLPLLALLIARVRSTTLPRRQAHSTVGYLARHVTALVAVGAIVAIVAIVATGHTDFVHTV